MKTVLYLVLVILVLKNYCEDSVHIPTSMVEKFVRYVHVIQTELNYDENFQVIAKKEFVTEILNEIPRERRALVEEYGFPASVEVYYHKEFERGIMEGLSRAEAHDVALRRSIESWQDFKDLGSSLVEGFMQGGARGIQLLDLAEAVENCLDSVSSIEDFTSQISSWETYRSDGLKVVDDVSNFASYVLNVLKECSEVVIFFANTPQGTQYRRQVFDNRYVSSGMDLGFKIEDARPTAAGVWQGYQNSNWKKAGYSIGYYIGSTLGTAVGLFAAAGVRRSVPGEWTCDESYYNTTDGCDCNCGVYDPDCDYPRNFQVLYGCYDGPSPTCNSSGMCEYNYPSLPQEWTCHAEYYNSTDGCDCGCGVPDPDCENMLIEYLTEIGYLEVFGCDGGLNASCVDGHQCVYDEAIPSSWVCDPRSYNGSDGCHCLCGAYDPDCDNNRFMVDCPCAFMGCDNGLCVGQCGSVYSVESHAISSVLPSVLQVLLVLILFFFV